MQISKLKSIIAPSLSLRPRAKRGGKQSHPSSLRLLRHFAPRNDTTFVLNFAFCVLSFALLFIGCGRRDNPVIPTKEIIGKCATPGYAKDVFILGDYAYIADGQGGLQIIDISNPAHPTIVGWYDTVKYAQGIIVRDTIAYIADGEGGLRIFDVSSPESIGALGSDSWIYAYDIFGISQNDSVFVFIAAKQWFIIDCATDPMYPSLVGRCEVPGAAHGVCVDDNYAYVASEQMGLQVIDVSDFHNPKIVGSCDTPGKALDVFVSGNYAYIADGREGLQIIDISNPEEPKNVGNYDTPGYANKVFVLGNYTYIADGENGLQVIDVSNQFVPSIVGECNTPYANSVYVTQEYIYLVDRDEGLLIIEK